MSGLEIALPVVGGVLAIGGIGYAVSRWTKPRRRTDLIPRDQVGTDGTWKEGQRTYYDPMSLPVAQLHQGVALIRFQGDITSIATDVMANSCFGGWLFFRGQGVDKAIARKAGWRLRFRSLFRWSRTGRVYVSPGYSSKAGRIYDVRAPKEAIHLNNLYRDILNQAQMDGAEVVTLPSFGTNDFGINIETAAPLVIESVKGWLDENVGTHVLKRIIFVTFSDGDAEVYSRALPTVAS